MNVSFPGVQIHDRSCIHLYIAHLVTKRRAHGTVLNNLSTVKQMLQVLGLELNEYTGYRFKLLLRGCKRVLGTAPLRKADITRESLSTISFANFYIP